MQKNLEYWANMRGTTILQIGDVKMTGRVKHAEPNDLEKIENKETEYVFVTLQDEVIRVTARWKKDRVRTNDSKTKLFMKSQDYTGSKELIVKYKESSSDIGRLYFTS